MIIGSGLLAKAFASRFEASPDICIYAAGVSNSGCNDKNEFLRERQRLSEALAKSTVDQVFLYFSTCSVGDDTSRNSDYVQHKIEMERLISQHANYIIARLPQVAGKTSNPHTLLNNLYAKILHGQKFVIWKNATRNILDIHDIVSIVEKIIENPSFRKLTVNIANPKSTPIGELVSLMEKVVEKKAVVEVVDQGSGYEIDISEIAPMIDELGLVFDDSYVSNVLRKYFGQRRYES